jgi:hypothetical protein
LPPPFRALRTLTSSIDQFDIVTLFEGWRGGGGRDCVSQRRAQRRCDTFTRFEKLWCALLQLEHTKLPTHAPLDFITTAPNPARGAAAAQSAQVWLSGSFLSFASAFSASEAIARFNPCFGNGLHAAQSFGKCKGRSSSHNQSLGGAQATVAHKTRNLSRDESACSRSLGAMGWLYALLG